MEFELKITGDWEGENYEISNLLNHQKYKSAIDECIMLIECYLLKCERRTPYSKRLEEIKEILQLKNE